MNGPYFARPTSSFGYYRGSPIYGGDTAAPDLNQGPIEQGVGQFPLGEGPVIAGNVWSPTILFLVGLVLVEMLVFGFLAKWI